MQECKTEGITLQSIVFKERSKIITVLTKDFGIVPLVVNGISSKTPSLIAITSLFCRSELVYKKTNSELGSFLEGSVINDHYFLRKELSFLKAAAAMTQATLKSQFPEKKAFGIYNLLKKYLSNIAINPTAITSSFLLKLLAYEDLLTVTENCSLCSAIASSMHKGESLCKEHAGIFAFNFTDEEFKLIWILTHAKKFSMLQNLDVPIELQEKVKEIFKDLV